MRPRLLAPLLLAAALTAACGQGQKETPQAARPNTQATQTLAGVDLAKHSVPLKDVHFDTFTGDTIPLSQITEQQLLALQDAIPPLSNPKYDDVTGGAWLQEADLVVGYAAGDAAYAYPLKILNFHEIVNDDLHGVPLLVTYCPLCRSGVVYDRRLEGRTLTFGNTSALYETDLVMYDHQTNSFWWQTAGEAIVGALTGQRLTPLPSATTTWGQWKRLHPNTLVLSRDTGFQRPYERDPLIGYEEYLDSGRFPFPVSEAVRDPRLRPSAVVLGLVVSGEARAYPLGNLGDAAINDELGGELVVVFSRAEGPSGAAFRKVVDGRTLTFRYSDGRYQDDETGSAWDFTGLATAGPLQAKRLEPLPSRYAFWFSFVSSFPKTSVYGQSQP